jgi:hypothetical protein
VLANAAIGDSGLKLFIHDLTRGSLINSVINGAINDFVNGFIKLILGYIFKITIFDLIVYIYLNYSVVHQRIIVTLSHYNIFFTL